MSPQPYGACRQHCGLLCWNCYQANICISWTAQFCEWCQQDFSIEIGIDVVCCWTGEGYHLETTAAYVMLAIVHFMPAGVAAPGVLWSQCAAARRMVLVLSCEIMIDAFVQLKHHLKTVAAYASLQYLICWAWLAAIQSIMYGWHYFTSGQQDLLYNLVHHFLVSCQREIKGQHCTGPNHC